MNRRTRFSPADPDRSNGAADPDEGAEDETIPLRQVLPALGRFHGSPRRVISALVVLSTLSGILEAIALVLFTSGALRATGGPATDTSLGPLSLDLEPGSALLVAAIATMIAAGMHAAQAKLTTNGSLRVLVNARQRSAAAFLRSDWTTQSEQKDGALNSSVFHLSQSASGCSESAAGVFNDIVIMVALTTVALVIAPTFTLVLAAAVVPITFILGPITQRAQRRAFQSMKRTDSFTEDVSVTQRLAFEIQAFGVVDQQIGRLHQRNVDAADAMRAGRFSGRLASYWFKDFALLMFIVVVGVIDLVWDLTQASAAAAILLVIRTLGYAQQSYNLYHQIIATGPAVVELENRLTELDALHEDRSGRPTDRIGLIEFDAVSYRYPNGRPALDDLSFTITPGRVLGIVGRSGAGKSTIAELLLRLRTPTAGQILVDGVDANQLSIDDWRRLVTIVPQDPRVMRASIADNIEFLREGYSRADIEHAARASHLAADIDQFEFGYDTELGSNNRGLSGGQRQRLAIARALISKPGVLVLDEPTSALDRHSEQRLQATLTELRDELTMVIIAHRLSTLDLCDDLLLLDAGRIVAHGPREEIMQSEDFFTSLPEHESPDH